MSGMVDIIFAPEDPPYTTKNKTRFQEVTEKGEPVDKNDAYCEKLYIATKKLKAMRHQTGQRLHMTITPEG